MHFNRTIRTSGLKLLIAAITAVLVCVWLFNTEVASQWPMRPLVVGGFLCAIIALSHWEIRRQTHDEHAARRAIERLCDPGHRELSERLKEEVLSELTNSNAWHALVTRLCDRLISSEQRVDDAEQASTAYDVRYRRLENEHARVREVLDRAPEPVIAINQYDEVTLANEPARNLFDMRISRDQVVTLQAAVQHRPLVDLLVETKRRKASSQRIGEFELTDSIGQLRWYRAVCRTLSENSAEPTRNYGAMVVLSEITNEKNVQKRHAEFVAAAAHEMKTPLSSIRAYVELLQDGEVEDANDQDEFWKVIETQTERLQRLIENLLNLARIEAGVVKVDKQQLSLNEVLEKAVEVVQPAAEQKSQQLVRDLSPMYLGVLADRDMILQAAINLLSNAVKYTPASGKITVRSRIDDGTALFEVEDTGIGLSPEDCDRIFEKFYRVKKDQHLAPGTGLGLPLAKHIVEDVHSGSLTVTSQLNEGSVFRVTLPVVGHGLT